MYRKFAGTRPSPARQTSVVALCAAIIVLTGIGVIGAGALILVFAGRIARVTMTHSTIGDVHHLIPILVAWSAVVVSVLAVTVLARTLWARLRRWLSLSPRPDHAPPFRKQRPSFLRARSIRESLSGAGEALLYIAVALVLIWPATFQLGRVIVGYGDSPYYLWLGWKVADLIHHGQFPLVIPDITWPYGANLLASDGYLSTLVIGLWNLVASPILAFNLAVITAILANCYAARHLARQLSSHRAIWIVTAIVFATAPCITRPILSQYNLVFLFPVALLAAEAVAVAFRAEPIRWLRLALLGFVAYLCSIYVLIFAAIAFLTIIVFGGVLARPRWWIPAAQLAAAALTTAVLMSPFIATHLRLEADERAHGAPRLTQTNDTYRDSSDVVSILGSPLYATIPFRPIYSVTGNHPSDLTVGPPPYADGLTLAVEPVLLPGYPMVLAFGLMLLLRHRLARAVAAAAAVCWLLSLGPTLQVLGEPLLRASPRSPPVDWLPYALLGRLPGLGALRAPARAEFAIAGVLCIAVALASAWLYGVIASLGSRPVRIGLGVAAGVVISALIATNLTIPNQTSTFPVASRTGASMAAAMAKAPDGPADGLIDIPADCTGPSGTHQSLLLQYYYRRPTVGCQQDLASIPWYSGIELYIHSVGLAALRCNPRVLGARTLPYPRLIPLTEPMLDEMKSKLRVRYALVDKRELRTCSWLIDSAMPVIARHRLLVADGDWALYDLDR
jgi:hypothetical protein